MDGVSWLTGGGGGGDVLEPASYPGPSVPQGVKTLPCGVLWTRDTPVNVKHIKILPKTKWK